MVSPERHSAAMLKIGALINVRERTIKEVKERLVKYEFTSEEIEDAIETAIRVNLINEERYTRAFIRGKSHSGWGKLKIIQRLQESNIPEEIIQKCSDEFSDSQTEYKTARNELSKKVAHSKNPYATYMRRLINRGFSYDISHRVVKEFLSLQ